MSSVHSCCDAHQLLSTTDIQRYQLTSSQHNKMLPFLLLYLALFVPILQCVDAVNHKAIFACVGLVTIQDHLQIDQVHNEIEELALKAFLSKNRLKQFRRRGARSIYSMQTPTHLFVVGNKTS